MNALRAGKPDARLRFLRQIGAVILILNMSLTVNGLIEYPL